MEHCNPENILELLTLFETPSDQRGDSWNKAFFAAVVDAPMINPEPKVFYGPDFFPYFNMHTPKPGETFDGFCISQMLEHLTEHGLGVAINSENGGQQVEWVFTCGEIMAYHMFGSLEPDMEFPKATMPKTEKGGQQILISQPSEELLPDYARDTIRRFLTEGLSQENPGVFLMQRRDQPTQELVFSLHAEDFESQGKFRDAMQTLSWFLPSFYKVTAIAKTSAFVNYFEPL